MKYALYLFTDTDLKILLRPSLRLNKYSSSRENLSLRGFKPAFAATNYRKVPKFSDARKICCNVPKIQTKSPNLRVFCQKDANGIANSEDPDQTAPLGAV